MACGGHDCQFAAAVYQVHLAALAEHFPRISLVDAVAIHPQVVVSEHSRDLNCVRDDGR